MNAVYTVVILHDVISLPVKGFISVMMMGIHLSIASASYSSCSIRSWGVSHVASSRNSLSVQFSGSVLVIGISSISSHLVQPLYQKVWPVVKSSLLPGECHGHTKAPLLYPSGSKGFRGGADKCQNS